MSEQELTKTIEARKYEPVIGLEVHAQMLTKSKAFCSCSTSFGAAPNHNTCPICLGHPGTMPALNENLVRFIVRMGLATNCTIRAKSIFARKNYFYPDLPKGYQISQYETPICHDGFVEIELKVGTKKKIGITRIHMEEDAGKSIHDFGRETLVDLNRAGVPLIEIVSEPDLRSSEEAYAYLLQMKSILTYLGICDGNMEEGSLRCDANVSIRPVGQEAFGQKTEVKNMNSFRNVQRALECEILRQTAVLESGGKVEHQTMQYDANKNVTRPMRSKEEAHDYRYFPEPDLLPVFITESYKNEIRAELPELQHVRRHRLVEELGIPAYDADVLTQDREVAEYYESGVKSFHTSSPSSAKLLSNLVMGEVMRIMTEKKQSVTQVGIAPEHLAELAELVDEKTISNKIAKDMLPLMIGSTVPPRTLVEQKGLVQVTDTAAIRTTVQEVIANNKDNLAKYRSGKLNLFGFFVGQTMKAMGGKGNPQAINDIVREELDKA